MAFVVLTFSREDKLVERAKALKVNAGTEPDTDLGPVISKQVSVIAKSWNFYLFITSSISFHNLTLKTSLYIIIETVDLVVLCCPNNSL